MLTLGDVAYTLAVMRVNFKKKSYTVVFTVHALEQMQLRGISEAEVIYVIERGTAKAKSTKGKFWVYLEVAARNDNLICVSLSIEPPTLIIITTLVNWRPE